VFLIAHRSAFSHCKYTQSLMSIQSSCLHNINPFQPKLGLEPGIGGHTRRENYFLGPFMLKTSFSPTTFLFTPRLLTINTSCHASRKWPTWQGPRTPHSQAQRQLSCFTFWVRLPTSPDPILLACAESISQGCCWK